MVNMAIMIDGQRPIGAKVRRISEFVLVLSLGEGQQIVITDMAQVATFVYIICIYIYVYMYICIYIHIYIL